MEILKKLVGKDSSTKYLFKLEDGQTVETLYMYDKGLKLTYHSTVCVSTQVGCTMGCRFCATAGQGFARNLTVNEIFEQVNICNSQCLAQGILPIDAVVFAGMGEPLLNYENVKAAVHKIHSVLGIKGFELATVGVVPRIFDMIKDFEDESVQIRLNLSLHAASDEQRQKLIPFTAHYDINTLMKAAEAYAGTFNSKIRVRYALFKGLNDRDEDIDRLCALLEDRPVKLIISQYNDNHVPGLIPPDQDDMMEFYSKVSRRINCGIFYNFGSDIRGGCGQLRQQA